MIWQLHTLLKFENIKAQPVNFFTQRRMKKNEVKNFVHPVNRSKSITCRVVNRN